MSTRAYVLYELAREPGSSEPLEAGVKPVSIAGDVLGWKVGHFELERGKMIFGVRIRYLDSLLLVRSTTYVALPFEARNIQFMLGDERELPLKFQVALKTA